MWNYVSIEMNIYVNLFFYILYYCWGIYLLLTAFLIVIYYSIQYSLSYETVLHMGNKSRHFIETWKENVLIQLKFFLLISISKMYVLIINNWTNTILHKCYSYIYTYNKQFFHLLLLNPIGQLIVTFNTWSYRLIKNETHQ